MDDVLTKLTLLAALLCAPIASAQENRQRSSKTAFSHALPKLDGDKLEASVVEVIYGPGAASPVHSHPCPVVGYVLQGSVRMQVKGSGEAIYKAGESFYEEPNGVHLVSANASVTEPAKFLAFFVCDQKVRLSTPVKEERK